MGPARYTSCAMLLNTLYSLNNILNLNEETEQFIHYFLSVLLL
jgi:hypothetical protein